MKMATFEGGKHLLGVGDTLLPGEYLVSPDRTARALLQDDGNLVVYKKQADGSDKMVWATHTYDGNTLGKLLGAKLIVQEDHNLVLYTKEGAPAWATNTHERGTGRATLALGDEGILVLVDEAEPPVALWNSGPSGLKALLDGIKAGATYLAQRAEYYAKLAAEKGSELAHQAGEKLQPYVTAAGEKIQPYAAKAQELGHQAADKAGQYAHAAQEKVQPYVTAAGEKLQPYVTAAGEKVQPYAAAAAEKLQPLGAKASEVAHQVADKAQEAYKKATS